MQDLVETDPSYVPSPGRFTTVWNDITNQLDGMLLSISPESTQATQQNQPKSENAPTLTPPNSSSKTIQTSPSQQTLQKPLPSPPPKRTNGTPSKQSSNIPNSISDTNVKSPISPNGSARSHTVLANPNDPKSTGIQRANTSMQLTHETRQNPPARALSPPPSRAKSPPPSRTKSPPPVPPKKATQPAPVRVESISAPETSSPRSTLENKAPASRGLTVSAHREREKVETLPSSQSEVFKKPEAPTPSNNTSSRGGLTSAEKRKIIEEKLSNMHGYLTKKGHVVKNWQSRFFVPDMKSKELTYFVDNTRKQLKGTVSLVGASVEELEGTWDGRDNCFVLKTSQKDFILSASSKKERMQWFYAIDYCINGSICVLTIKDDDIEKLFSSFGETHEPTSSRGTILAPVNLAIPFVACAGWVEKKGHKNTAWQRRWLVLSDPKQTFCRSMLYFDSNENGGSNKKGEIILVGGSIERVKEIGKKRNCFIIHTNRDTKPISFELATDTFEECELWIKCIGEAIDFLKTSKLQYSGQQGTK